ncbi:MAG TPA: hypothetical protein VJ953_12785 [Saprospiraceae bacterium]|nr:hypothetical protein [Saprospiraceae bacterium]
MLGMLQVVIGLVFVLLLLSLLATTIMELLSSFFALRGKNLETALRNMLSSADSSQQLFKEFKNNSLYRQLSQKAGKSRRSPSYLAAGSFQSILFDVILKGEKIDKIVDKIEALPDDDLKNVLKQLLNDAEYELEDFKGKIHAWYDNIMDRASGWYKRTVQKIIVLVGLVIAVVFNADTLAIYERLESDPESLQQVLELAENYLAKTETEQVIRTTPTFDQQMDNVRALINNEIEQAKSPLGLGWEGVTFFSFTPTQWGVKILGWIVTALAISLGAPFWFDMLKKLVNIRGSGNKPN